MYFLSSLESRMFTTSGIIEVGIALGVTLGVGVALVVAVTDGVDVGVALDVGVGLAEVVGVGVWVCATVTGNDRDTPGADE